MGQHDRRLASSERNLASETSLSGILRHCLAGTSGRVPILSEHAGHLRDDLAGSPCTKNLSSPVLSCWPACLCQSCRETVLYLTLRYELELRRQIWAVVEPQLNTLTFCRTAAGLESLRLFSRVTAPTAHLFKPALLAWKPASDRTVLW